MLTFLDVETTFQERNGKRDPSPVNPKNKLVSLGWINEKETKYICLNHNDEPPTPSGRDLTQQMLDETTLLVAHNMKFDLGWLLACDFHYVKSVWCTMIAEYVLAGGIKKTLDLESCCQRHGINDTKDRKIQEFWENGIGFEAMPWPIVQDYGLQDIFLLKNLYHKQLEAIDEKIKCLQ